MPVLFVDANAYLIVYRAPLARKLLDYLGKYRERVFITQQIVDEVNRNKLKLVQEMFKDNIEIKIKINIQQYLLEDHDNINELRKKGDELRGSAQSVREELDALACKTIEAVSCSTDPVSKSLKAIFETAVSPSADTLERGRRRRESGNPPGKKGDPLGDQLTWEQFLERLAKDDDVWIISSDGDYCLKHEGKLYLNPVLRAEIEERCGGDAKISCFPTLAEGIEDFASRTEIGKESIPPAQELEEIREEEEQAAMSIEMERDNPPSMPSPVPHPLLPRADTAFLVTLQRAKGECARKTYNLIEPCFQDHFRRSHFRYDRKIVEMINRVSNAIRNAVNARGPLSGILHELEKCPAEDSSKKAELERRRDAATQQLHDHYVNQLIPELQACYDAVSKIVPR